MTDYTDKTNEERARELLQEVCNACWECSGSQAKLVDALVAAEARGLERAEEWHVAEAEECRKQLKKMTANPLRHERCREDGSLDYAIELAGWHDSSAAAIRALKEECQDRITSAGSRDGQDGTTEEG